LKRSVTLEENSTREQMKVCALVPVFNEAPHVGKVVTGSLAYVESVFVVDDGSSDRSGEIAREAGALVFRHSINCGKGEALKTGFAAILKEEKWDGVLVLDGDGQHDWNEIPRFVSCLVEGGYDIVLGNRMGDVQFMPLERKITNWLSSRVLSALTHQKIKDSQCGFRLIRTNVLKALALRTQRFDMESEMLLEAARKGFRIGDIPTATIYGTEKSSVHPVLDTLRFVLVALRYTFRAIGRHRGPCPNGSKNDNARR
jgi:glycosyltransferase involved in cell wall biosynthesis